MLASDIAGVPLSEKSKLPAMFCLPEEVASVTVPTIITLEPSCGTVCGAEIVVALGPLPKQYIMLSNKSSVTMRPSAIIGAALGQQSTDHSNFPSVVFKQ